jgi:hypothetical protein
MMHQANKKKHARNDCIGRCKSNYMYHNYHMISAMTAPFWERLKHDINKLVLSVTKSVMGMF